MDFLLHYRDVINIVEGYKQTKGKNVGKSLATTSLGGYFQCFKSILKKRTDEMKALKRRQGTSV